MTKHSSLSTHTPRARAFLVGVELYGQNSLLSLEDSLNELSLLAETAGMEVVGELTQKMERPNSVTFIGSGKVEELKALVEETLSEVVVFDDELNPRHLRELEQALGTEVRVLDRTEVILDIFAQHAHTSEGQLQVKLAQYEYSLPRLTRQWTHLARQAGGGGGRSGSTGGVGLRGPGETQLEVDRRAVRKEIGRLKAELEKVRTYREHYRAQRKRSRMPTVVLVGYTNAGKSTLLNHLSNADVYVADALFATLDPTTRRVELPENETALFTDTVGFIQKLPTTLVAAFRATLEEIADAELLVHVVDISHPNALNQAQAVQQTLEEIGAGEIPVVTALNKIDRLADPAAARKAVENFPGATAISARTGEGISDLLQLVRHSLFESFIPIQVRLPYQEGQLISLFYESGQVERTQHGRAGVLIQGRIPGRLLSQFKRWQLRMGDRVEEGEDPLQGDQDSHP
jgi:GTP-binding protein HflX